MMDGVLNVLKPPGMTSSDVVVYLRSRLREKRIGHTGTLDPDAAGVLPICLGRATRLSDYLMAERKTYLAELTLGISTTTQDASGEVTAKRVPAPNVLARLDAAIPPVIGEIDQIPPAYSAIHIQGQKAYQLARQGKEAQIPPRRVTIHAIERLPGRDALHPLIRVHCGKGVYIRSLAHDLGEAIGCGAHLSFLLREKTGAFLLENALTLDEIMALHQAGELDRAMIAPADALGDMPMMVVAPRFAQRLACGNAIEETWIMGEKPEGSLWRVFCNGEFYGIAAACEEDACFAKFRAMLYRAEGA